MTLPLLEGLDGVNKMSKSLGNYIGVSESPKDIFGKAMSVSDELMWRYFSLVLCLPDPAIRTLRDDVAAGRRHPRDVKDEMARQVVARFYPEEQALASSAEFKRVFSKQMPSDIPVLVIPPAETSSGRVSLVGLLTRAGLAASNSEARRLIQQGAVEVDDARMNGPRGVH